MDRTSARAVVLVAVIAVSVVGFAVSTGRTRAVGQSLPAYRSPYRVEFSTPASELVGDLDRTERGDPSAESAIRPAQWYSAKTRERWGSWGPPAQAFPAPAGSEAWSGDRKRERVIAVALRYVGLAYQHHHIPSWDPPPDWPWQPVAVGRNGKGVDCSNFTAFVYNIGLGLRLTSDVHKQAELTTAIGPGPGAKTPISRVELPSSYRERVATLRTGDLLFIKNREGNISHVVLWVGRIGRSPDGVPLIIDSHGSGIRDADHQAIPDGVRLRPFRADSWYNGSASHALRVVPADSPD